MSAADEIARLRAPKWDAPPLPYRYREGAEGDPSNGPTFTALEAEHPDLSWSEIARGDYDAWSGYGLRYAAEACTALPKALAALEAVLALHRPHVCGEVPLWQLERGACFIGHDGCLSVGTCRECQMPYPCTTVTAVAEALGVEP